LAGVALANAAERRHSHYAELDADIGVSGGDMGAAGPDQPAARIGACSSGAAGAGSAVASTPSEGPIQELDD
jgi:hypothetical protein